MRATFLLCVALSIPAGAAAEEASGRVRALYVEEARGVLVDAGLRKGVAPRWADVELDGVTRLLVQVPRDLRPAVGDLVSLRLGEPKSTQLAKILPAATPHRALALTPQSPRMADNAPAGRPEVR